MLPYLESAYQSNYTCSLHSKHDTACQDEHAFLNAFKIPMKALLKRDELEMAVHEIAFKAGIVGVQQICCYIEICGSCVKKKAKG